MLKNFLGKEAEDTVARILKAQNWDILVRNFRGVGTELDIVASKGQTLAIVEVKFRKKKIRTSEDMLNMMNPRKLEALARGAETFLSKKNLNFSRIRFDLALVYGQQLFVDYYPDYFQI